MTSKTNEANNATATATATKTAKSKRQNTSPTVLPVEIDEQGVAVLRLGQPEESVVTFTRERLEALGTALDELGNNARVRGVIITGPRPGMFCAGADINLIHSISSVAEGVEAANEGRSIFQRCRHLSVPVGPALSEGRIARRGASRGSGLALSTINWAKVNPSVSSTLASDSRMRISCSAPRRVSTTTGSSRSLESRMAATRRAARRVRMS